MPSIQVTGQLVDPTTGLEGGADIRIASLINYGQTTKKSISHESTDASGNYDFQLVNGKHLILVKFDGDRIYSKIGYAVVGDSTPDPVDLIQLINLSDENPPSELVTDLQQLREDTINDIIDTSAQVLENAGYQGEWVSGTSTALKGETWQVNGRYYVALKNTSVDPVNDNENWREVVNTESVTTAQNDIVGGSIFKGSNGETVEVGDVVPSGTTHLRVLVGGNPAIVSMSPVVSGVVSLLTESSATIGATPVTFSLREIQFEDINEMISNAGSYPIGAGSILRVRSGQSFVVSTSPSSVQEISLVGTAFYANIAEGDKYYGEAFGGFIYDSTTQVALGKIYLNLIKTDNNYGSYIYFDAPEMPVSPVDYASSYGGTVKNGIFAFTGRDSVEKKTLIGYRAGLDSISTFCTYVGQQAGELTVDVKESTDTGGSCGFGLIALYNAQSRSTCAMGMEAGNQSNSDNSVFNGTYAGGAVVGDKLVLNGYQAGYQSTLTECTGSGYGALVSSISLKSNAVGAFSQNSSTGDENNSIGHRSLSQCAGSFNFGGGNWAGFVTGGSSASNRTLTGHEAGRESDVDGISGFGRGALKDSTGSFASGLGYLAGSGNTYARVTLLGQQTSATGADQVQIGGAGTTPYAYAALQIRSDARDKTDFNPVSDGLKDFFFDVEFQTYRLNPREAYREFIEVDDGEEIVTDLTPVKNDKGVITEWVETERVIKKTRIDEVWLDNDGSKAGKRHHAGVVAQQVKEAMDKNGVDFAGYQDHSINGGEDRLSIAYEQFIPIIGAIVQDHNKKLIALESKIDSLEERLAKAGI